MNSKSPTNSKDEIDLVAFIGIMWEFKYVIVVVTAVFGFASLFIALTATPIYRADVVVSKVNDSNMTGAASLASQFGSLGRLAGLNVGQMGPSQEAQAVLESRHLTEEFIKRNKLFETIVPAVDSNATLWKAVQRFRDIVLTIREDVTDGTSVISIEWSDPITAAQWANDYVALANELIRTRAIQLAEENLQYLRQQADETNVVELQRVIYNLIQSQIQTLMLANSRDEYAFTVVDPAVAPDDRSRPRRKLIVLSGGALGLFFGVLAAFAINVFRNVIRKDFPRPG